VYNNTGTVNISGGSISATTGSTVSNNTGTVNISGGTVQATTGNAVYNYNTGKISVSQPGATPTVITSANTSDTGGTITLANTTTTAGIRLEITGGTISNTATSGGRYAIYNSSNTASQVTISGSAVINGEKYGCP